MDFHAAARTELEELLASPGPSLTLLRGAPGTGRTTLLGRVARAGPGGATVLRHTALPLPGPDQRAAFAAALARDLGESSPGAGWGDDGATTWSDLLDGVAARVEERRDRLVVAVDDAHHLLESDRAVGEALESFRGRLRARALPVHLVLSGRSPDLSDALGRSAPSLAGAADLDLVLRPAGVREVGHLVAGWSPRDRVRAWAVFGGSPERLRWIDPTASLAANVRRLFLEAGAPLLRHGLHVLAGSLQTPARYVSLLRALSGGARDWGDLRRACPDFESGSQMAPYVSRLEALGLVEIRRSLDAGERSRNRRYEIPDPGLAFWYRVILPIVGQVELGGGDDLWARAVKPRVDDHVAAVLPHACRGWLAAHGDDVLPGRARLTGGLWGPDYELEVAGTLLTGAPFYGTCTWREEPVHAGAFDDVGAQLRRTRYGFGREARHRVVFAAAGFTPDALRATAREPWTHGVDLEALLGP